MRKLLAWTQFLLSLGVLIMVLLDVPGSKLLSETRDAVNSLWLLLSNVDSNQDESGTPSGKNDVPPAS